MALTKTPSRTTPECIEFATLRIDCFLLSFAELLPDPGFWLQGSASVIGLFTLYQKPKSPKSNRTWLHSYIVHKVPAQRHNHLSRLEAFFLQSVCQATNNECLIHTCLFIWHLQVLQIMSICHMFTLTAHETLEEETLLRPGPIRCCLHQGPRRLGL